jgi:hypothetical protein
MHLIWRDLEKDNKMFETVTHPKSRHADLLVLKRDNHKDCIRTQEVFSKVTSDHHIVSIHNIAGVLRLARHTRNLCRSCLKSCGISLEKHLLKCAAYGSKTIKFPTEKYFRFRKPYLKMPVEYTIYFKIMTYFKPNSSKCIDETDLHHSNAEGNFYAASFFIMSVSAEQKIDFQLYIDTGNIMEQFFTCIFEFQQKYTDLIRLKPIPLNPNNAMKDEYKYSST